MKKIIFFLLLLISSHAYSQVNLTQGLVGYFPFNGNANDASGNNVNGVVNNATLTTDRTGQANGAYYFNGTSSSIELPFSNLYNFAPSGSFSISVWVQPDLNNSWPAQAIVVKAPYKPNFINSDWNYGIYSYNYKMMTGYANTNFLIGTTTFATQQCWYNLIVTYNNGKWAIYVNGNLENSDNSQTHYILQDNSSMIDFGKKGEANGDYYQGKMDDVRIYNRVLNSQEITAISQDRPCILQCIPTNAINISSGYSFTTNASIAVGQRDSSWTIVSMSSDMQNALSYNNETNGVPTPPPGTPNSLPANLGDASFVIPSYPGMPAGVNLISCFPYNLIYTLKSGVTNYTNCTTTIRKQFFINSSTSTQVNFNFSITCDDAISKVIIDAGTPNAITLLNAVTNSISPAVTITSTQSLSPGTHTIDIQCNNLESATGGYYTTINGSQYQWNPFAIGVSGSITSTNNVLQNKPCCTPTSVTIDTTICPGQSFLTHTTTGTYKDTITNVAGCDSIITTNLTIKSNCNCPAINSINITTGYNATTNSIIPAGQRDSSWIVTAISNDMKNSFSNTNTPSNFVPPSGVSASPAAIGTSPYVIKTYPSPWIQTDTYLSCFPFNTIYTPKTQVDNFTNCTVTIQRTFFINSATSENVNFNFHVSVDNAAQSVIIDAGTPNAITLYTYSGTLGTLIPPVQITTSKVLAPGNHTLTITAANFEEANGIYYTLPSNGTQGQVNPFGIAVNGTITSTNNVLQNKTCCITTSSTIDTTICQGKSFLNHIITGTYNDTLTNSGGCDSIVTTHLTVTPQNIGFTAPDTVCINSPINIVNTSTCTSSYFWSFCSANINSTPDAVNLGNPGNYLSGSVFSDYVKDDLGNYHLFINNYSTGNLVRWDFGNNMLNTPTATNLGNFGGKLLPGGTEGIQVVYNENKWYAFVMVGIKGNAPTAHIIKIEFGASITNASPVATDWGNIGSLSYPHDIYMFQQSGNWYGLVVNKGSSTITLFNFTGSFSNTPTATNLGNIGNLDNPTGIYAIYDGGNWYAYVVNSYQDDPTNPNYGTITRLNFGNSLLNTPTAVNLGNIGGLLNNPRDIYIVKVCGNDVGFVVNENLSDVVKLDFHNNLTSVPTGSSLGNIGQLNGPHSISKFFRVGSDLYSFVTNLGNSITRLRFAGCTGVSIPSSTAYTPPTFSYSSAGTYTINLVTDDSLPTQSSYCKQIVVLDGPSADFSFNQDVCNPKNVTFTGTISSPYTSYKWDFGNNTTNTSTLTPNVTYSNLGTYTVQFSAINTKGCTDTATKKIPIVVTSADIITTKDTTICFGSTKKLQSKPALEYCWSPSIYLDNTATATPVTSTPKTITYYLTSKIQGTNLITNGDFNNGNTGFTSAYTYTNNNTTAAQYFIGTNPKSWNPGMSSCSDHTGASGNGNMMLVNGSSTPNVNVWKQIINVTPNTNYAFSAWGQNLTVNDPTTSSLQFSINDNLIGNVFKTNFNTCVWENFYAIWNSGNNTTATISLVNNTLTFGGNDFALDDISFAPLQIQQDSVIITVDTPAIKTSNDTTICAGSNVQLATTGATSYKWNPTTALSNPNIGNPVAAPTDSTQYIVTGTNSYGCTANDTVTILIKPKLTITKSPDVTICKNTTTQLNVSGGTSYQWQPANTLSDPAISNPVASPTATTIYTVTVSNPGTCANVDSIKVIVDTIFNFDFSYIQDVCNPLSVQFSAAGTNTQNPVFLFGDGDSITNNLQPTHVYTLSGTYTVKFSVSNANGCRDTITKIITIGVIKADVITTQDTTICFGASKQLQSKPGLEYCWTPSTYLDNASLAAPTTSTPRKITYYLNSKTPGKNLITNGDFTAGNTGFTSQYNFANPNQTEGQYFISANPKAWNGGLGTCNDHTTATGNMMLVNGSPTIDAIIWSETILVSPNTNYAFAAWIQSLSLANPAQLKFSINGIVLGNTIIAPTGTCTWQQFYSSWNSGNNSTAVISIVNKNTIKAGNDFALDDISFSPVEIQQDSVVINVDTAVIKTSANASICSGKSSSLSTSGAASYQWSPVTGLSNASIGNPVASPANTTKYIVTGITVDGCIAKDSVVITVLPKPTITKSQNTAICKNTTTQLSVSGGVSYQWQPGSTLNNPTSATPIASPTNNTTYYVLVTDVNNCTNTDSVQISIRPDPVFTVSPNQTVCTSIPVQLNANGGDIYLWSPANLVSDPSIANPVTTPVQSKTTYTVTIKESTCNNSTTLSTTITLAPPLTIVASKSNDLDCSNGYCTLTASGANYYVWSPGDALNDSTSSHPIASPLSTQQYIVKGKSVDGCIGSDTITIFVNYLDKSGYYMPNAFTPNRDGLNDCFGIKYWGRIDKLDFSIYDRWGNQVFHTNNPDDCWNGLYAGVPANAGNYVYYIVAQTACGNINRKGNVVLLR
ncbi:LamG-like jellyroll fold domain-containing protein [Ferruginibacter albus]|uniref:LamG-like jellyroll fold domain-containing protein n=1 Tax=Ferruginibacter albus TaxID=2875540 RepID=UPI001CC6B297|nr:LamG-like jellyroll fold domain-containing protein [Ferruginibacter albus]UAY53112.1 gliding motility-associated C-terminal domain-containing protein [Ferruginibacter albus]